MTTTNDTSAAPYVAGAPCDRCHGTHAEGDRETGERLPCTRCFGMSPRGAALDLDAIEARIGCAPSCDCGEPSTQWCADSECGAEACDGHARQTGALGHEHRWLRYPVATGDARALVARVRDLAAKLDASAQAFDALVAEVWRATGETHEPPADVAALLRRVIDDHRALAGFRRAMLDVCERLDGVRPEPDFDAPAELGAWTCEEIGRRVASARREGAEAMREESAQAAARVANAWAQCECRCACGSSLAGLAAAEACTAEIRALPIVEAP